MAAMAEIERSSPQIIVEEIRRQVDLQARAADGLDTRAMAIFAGISAVAAIVAPRVKVTDGSQIAAGATLGALILALICLLQAVRARIEGFSNGPDVDDLKAYADLPAADLQRELVDAFVGVKKENEDFLKCKGGWMIRSLVCVMGTVAGIAWLVAVGGLQ